MQEPEAALVAPVDEAARVEPDPILLELNTAANDPFTELLRDPEGYEMFLQFLRTTYCEHHLIFYSAVQQFQRLELQQPKLVEAKRIYSEYIEPGCMHQINLSDAARHRISTQLAADGVELSTNLFDESAAVCLHLLSNHFIPFIESPQYQAHLQTKSSKSTNDPKNSTNSKPTFRSRFCIIS